MKKFTLNTLIIAISLFFIGTVNAQTVIDLTASSDPNVLVDTLDGISSGDIVLLKPGMTYNAGGFEFFNSVTIQSSDPLNLNRPKIDCSSNYKFLAGSAFDSIIFKNLEFMGGYDDRYILNVDTDATVGKVVLDGCYIHDLRGVFRMKGGTGSLDNFVINNSMVNMIRDYGILAVDVNTWIVNNILFQNSTFSKTRTFLTSRNNSTSVIIDGCTLNEYTASGKTMFRWREAGLDNVLNGILVKNTLWGTGWDELVTGSTGFDGFEGLATTIWTFENTYVTSDYDIADTKDSIVGFNNVYAGLSTELWANPAEDSLNYADEAFAGIGNAGDQRWGIATDDGGVEWNISHAAFNALGTMEVTKKVAGLNIFAGVGKSVVVDANNKTVGAMSFTNRMKLGGTGAFDADGLPLNRVLTIDLDHSSAITVAAMSSSGTEDRVLNVAVSNKDNLVGEHAALGASLTMSTFNYLGGPATLMLYSPSSGINVYYISTIDIANIDSLLSGLSVDIGNLDPAFDPTVDSYAVELPFGTTNVNITAVPNDPNATVTGAGDVDVSSGSAVATLTVLAEDGVSDMEYTISFTVKPTPANITFIVDDTNQATATGFAIKGSWDTESGEYDALWTGGAEHSVFFDDGTNGDATAGDHIWTVTLELVPDGGVNTWEWGVNDANGNWIDGNFQFTVPDATDQTLDAFVIVGLNPVSANVYSIYPNPASSLLHIDNAEQINRVEVISLAGQRILQKVNKGNSFFTLSVDGIPSGVYVLRLTENNNAISHQKLIVE